MWAGAPRAGARDRRRNWRPRSGGLVARCCNARSGLTATREALYADARLALEWSLELEPGHASAQLMLARVELGPHGHPEKATALLVPLVVAAPAREDYRLMLAEALLAQHDYKGAAEYLGPLLARSRSAATRNAARGSAGACRPGSRRHIRCVLATQNW